MKMTISTKKQNIIISWSQTVNTSTCRFKTAIDSASLSAKMCVFFLFQKKRVLQDALELMEYREYQSESTSGVAKFRVPFFRVIMI